MLVQWLDKNPRLGKPHIMRFDYSTTGWTWCVMRSGPKTHVHAALLFCKRLNDADGIVTSADYDWDIL